jgi:NADH:ubiquinone oxidoreductase subunit H
MIGVGMALIWFGVVSISLLGCALVERGSRLRKLDDRPSLRPRRAEWGLDLEPPPASYAFARALAGGARIVRSRSRIGERLVGQRVAGRVISCVAIASALSLVPFAGSWGGRADGMALVVVDLQYGLIALVFLVMLMAMAQVTLGLSDRSVWSRLGSVRLGSSSLGGLGLLVIVLAPLALDSGSLRFHEILLVQQTTFGPLAWLPSAFDNDVVTGMRGWRWPNWNLFSQPLTALLFIPALGSLTNRPRVDDATTGTIAASGFGLDNDPVDLYWGRLEARLARILAASLFVTLFLGAGAIPFVPARALVDLLEPIIGPVLPALLGALLQIGVFVAKLMLVLVVAAFLRRVSANLRDDQWIETVTLRLLPLAWANLLLMSAIELLPAPGAGGG